jgi:hypothetical protein
MKIMDPIYSKEPASPAPPSEEKSGDEILLWKTAIDPYGRRSMALQRGNGEITTWTEMWERTAPGPSPEDEGCRKAQRRLDELMCWYLFEDWKSARMRSALQVACLPVFFLKVGLFFLWLYLDDWRGRRHSQTRGSA